MQVTPLVMANGKTPQNFPVTKGEFEHLTSMSRFFDKYVISSMGYSRTKPSEERYEFLLKSYGVPLKGDTAAKRQTLREFIGLSPAKP